MLDVIHFYRVEDLKNVRRFYGEILRLPLYKDQGQCLIYCVRGHGKIGFCTHHPKTQNQTSCITFVYETKEDIDDMHKYLTSQVGKLSEPHVNSAFQIYHFYMQCFEGLTLEFQAFL